MRALDQKDVVRLLRSEVNRAGSQQEWAKENGVAPSSISMVLSGERIRRSSARSNSAESLHSNELMNRTARAEEWRSTNRRHPLGCDIVGERAAWHDCKTGKRCPQLSLLSPVSRPLCRRWPPPYIVQHQTPEMDCVIRMSHDREAVLPARPDQAVC
jgi:hypothetical protein